MPVTNLDELMLALKKGQRLSYTKSSVNTVASGSNFFWLSTGFPLAGAIPTAAAVCNNALVGALPLINRTGLEERLLGLATYTATTAATTLEVEDRLAHMGGLNGTLTTVQTVGVDCSLTTSNLVERIGATDYSEIEWWLDVYATLGATSVTPTFNVTFNDNTTGTANLFILPIGTALLPASALAGRRWQIIGAKPIKSIQSVLLSGTTGTVGNFGVTAVRKYVSLENILAGKIETYDYAKTGLPKIPDQACVSFSGLGANSTTGAVFGSIRQAVN